VRFAFGAHVAEVYRSHNMVLLLAINQSGDVQYQPDGARS
jgi:hypothetical protein